MSPFLVLCKYQGIIILLAKNLSMTKTNFKSFHSVLDQGVSQKPLRRKATSIQYRIKNVLKHVCIQIAAIVFTIPSPLTLETFIFNCRSKKVLYTIRHVYTKENIAWECKGRPGPLSVSHFYQCHDLSFTICQELS